MKTIANILWVLFVGLATSIGWLIGALLLALPIVTLPFARQCLKFAHYTLWPFGRTHIVTPRALPFGLLGNIIWFIPGLFLAFGYLVGGLLLCITVIGIPFGLQSFKFAGLALAPFGKEIVRTKDLRSGQWAHGVVQEYPQ